jgi:hypothetical protein
MWLFIVENQALADPPGESELAFAAVNRLNTLAWSQSGKTYLLAAARDRMELLRITDPGP